MKRDVCAALVKERIDPRALVVCAMGSTGGAWRRQGASQPTYFVSDPMGMALPMALGLALAQPSRDVILLGGDGDFVMSLSALLTVAEANVKRLKIAIFNNGRYESGGGQPLSASGRFSLAAIGRGAGFAWSETVEEATAPDMVSEWMKAEGPALLIFTVDPESFHYPPTGRWAKMEERTLFMQRVLDAP